MVQDKYSPQQCCKLNYLIYPKPLKTLGGHAGFSIKHKPSASLSTF